jgi:eukaryotic-like serine/threonine-protein kinase
MERGKVVAGKYRLNQLLGSGGMAEVWSATNTFTERQIAIKFMNAQVAKTPEAAARFLKEAKVSARVDHPNIIEIHDVGQTEEGQLFLVMELLTGFPLEVGLRRQNPPMTIYEFSLVMVEVAQALAAAHKSGIIHRDLKPTNIFLHKVREGVAIPKLLDFGVSKFLEDDQNHALTVAGTVLGSPLYMSPEQARGDANLDGRTDIFAFGAILFEALVGYRAYDAKNFNALIVKIATTRPKAIDACALHLPESIRRVVRACLEPEVKKRVPTFDDVVAMLRAAMPELEASMLRLPTPLVATAVIDPDATNALPVLRASDRPPPMPALIVSTSPHGANDTIPSGPPASFGATGSTPLQPPAGTGSGSVPPGAVPVYPSSPPSGPSWHTPNTSYASVSVPPPKRSPAWLVGLGAVLVVAGISIGAIVTTQAQPGQTAARVGEPPKSPVVASPQGAGASPAETATGPAETPGVSIDTLPSKPLGPIPSGSGRLVVNAAPGSCAITVDGRERGTTPLASLDLPAGPHQLVCKAQAGKPRTATVTVLDGATSKYRFALDD